MQWSSVFSQVSQFKIKSVTDSLFKYGIYILSLGVVLAIFSDKDFLIYIMFVFAGLFFLIGILFFSYFAIKKPDFLRSETYQTKKQALELLGDSENSLNKNLRNVHLITSPQQESTKVNGNLNPLLENE